MYFFQTTLFESAAKKVACEIDWEVDIEWEVFNKSQSNSTGTFFFWFICTLPFETSGTASCGTTGIISIDSLQYFSCDFSCDISKQLQTDLLFLVLISTRPILFPGIPASLKMAL